MLDTNFLVAFSSSFWIIPREGTEALLVILMLCSAMRESGRIGHMSIIYKNCWFALGAGLMLALGCIELKHFFTGQSRELSEAFASIIAMSMLLYVNFSVFQSNGSIKNMSNFGLGAMTFVSVFRELAEVVLFYFALFHGGRSQQAGTLLGIISGILILGALFYTYKTATSRWKTINRFIFNITPFMFFLLAIMCIGNAINSFQEAGWVGFTPVNWMINSNVLHIQASVQYVLAVSMFIACTGLMFLRQFTRSISNLLGMMASPYARESQ